MPRLTNNSLSSLSHCVPLPGIFPNVTLKQKDNQLVETDLHDLRLACEDGLVVTNQCVMAAASTFVRKLLADCHLVEAGRTGRKEDMVTLHLPELDHTSVARVVTCFTEGVVRLPLSGGAKDQNMKKKLEAAWRVLGIDRVELDEIFKNTYVQPRVDIIEIEEEVVNTEENVIDIKEEDVPDRLQALCSTGIISIGAERKRKGDNVRDELDAGVDEEKGVVNEDLPLKSRRSVRTSSAFSNPPKKRKSYEPGTVVVPTEDNGLKETVFIKSDPDGAENAMEETSKRGRGRGRQKRSLDYYTAPVSPPPMESPSTVIRPQYFSETKPIIVPSTKPIIVTSTKPIIVPSTKSRPIGPPALIPQPIASQRQSSARFQPVAVQPQPASFNCADFAEKRAKVDQTPFALEPITCFVCQKSEDKDRRILNLKNLFYLRNHFAKCLYNDGRVFNAVPPGAENTGEDGRPKDEFGMKNGFMYKCQVAGCWLHQKKGTHSQVCYKVYAIHMISQHGVMEKVLEEDNRPEPQYLLQKIRAYERGEVISVSPNNAVVVRNIKEEGDKKNNEVKGKVFHERQVLKKSTSAWDASLVQEIIEDKRDDDPDDPSELSEIVQPSEIEPKIGAKTFRQSEDVNVFRKVNTNVNNSVLNIFKPVDKRVEQSSFISNVRDNNFNNDPNPTLDEKYRLTKDGFHTCFLCDGVGKNNKDSHHLSFKNLIKLKEHYARCIYNEGNMHNFVHPGDDNVDKRGKPVDEFGKANGKMYKCKIQGCWLQRKQGLRGHVCYKVYSIHMASQHGVLETILENDHRPFMKEILRGIRREEGGKESLARCRFETCKDIQFKVDVNKRELKMHYSTLHFRRWFEGRDNTGLDRMPVMEFSAKGGTRAKCEKCTTESNKPIYIQGDNEAVIGHLVVKHDLLVEALREAGDRVKETKDVVKDLYPEQVTEFYMATLTNQRGAVPLNEDFMDKMFI